MPDLLTVQELDVVHDIRRRASHERWRGILGDDRGPYVIRLSSGRAEMLRRLINKGQLHPTETGGRPELKDNETWIALIDGVHVVEARRQ